MTSLDGVLTLNSSAYDGGSTMTTHRPSPAGGGSNMTAGPLPVTVASWLPLVAVSVFIIVMNGFLIVAFVRGRKHLLKASSGVLLCNQATSDLLNGVLFIPTIVVERIQRQSAVSPFVVCYIFYVSLFSLCLLALDRFLSIVRPIHHRCYFRETSLFKFVATVWVLPMVLALIPFFWWFKPINEQQGPSLVYFAFLWVVMFIFSVAMVVLYVITFDRVKRIISNRQEENKSELISGGRNGTLTKRLAKKELRLTKLFCSLLLVFILSYIPVILVNLFHLAGKGRWVTPAFLDASLYSFVSSSLINPLLCVWMQTKLREEIISLITCRSGHQGPSRNSSATVTFLAHRSKGPSDDNGHTETAIKD